VRRNGVGGWRLFQLAALSEILFSALKSVCANGTSGAVHGGSAQD
jgi:hypothetical protein